MLMFRADDWDVNLMRDAFENRRYYKVKGTMTSTIRLDSFSMITEVRRRIFEGLLASG